MGSVVIDRNRTRLAKALADFWFNGAGPTHGEVDDALAVAGVRVDGGSKRDKVSEGVKLVPEPALFTLVDQLIELLRDRSLPQAADAEITRLHDALGLFGFHLDDHFQLTSAHRPDLARLPDRPALREHVDRLQRAIRDGDDAQLLGSTKELLESTAKVVLDETGKETPSKFPSLLTAAFEALQIHPKATPSTGTPLEDPVRKIVGGALQIVLGIDELRNTHGTGHGRAAPVVLSRRHARLAAGAGVTVTTFMLDTLDDPSAPWRQSRP